MYGKWALNPNSDSNFYRKLIRITTMPLSNEDIDSILLRSLAFPYCDSRFCFLGDRVREQLRDSDARPGGQSIMQAVWSLVARRLAYIDYSQPDSSNWSVKLTERGWEAVNDSNLNPDDIPLYLRRVATDIPELGSIPRFYLDEALRAYSSDCFSASTMMLGVAAEAVFFDVATPFATWLNSRAGKALAEILEKPTVAYVQKFVEFQKRLAASKGDLPAPLQQNLDLNINSVLELLRLARNEVGHPTGIQVDRHSAFQYLVIFPGLAQRLYDLKKHFETTQQSNGAIK